MALMAYAVLLSVGLLGAAIAGPISWDDSKCSRECSSEQHKFKYEEGKTYVYSFLSQTQMGLTEDESESVHHDTQTEVRAKAEIHVKGPCEMILMLSDVSLSGTGEDKTFKQALEANPLPFSFDDGNIREICPSPVDQAKPFVLNIKRAILSSLKNTMDKLDVQQERREVDIAGNCLTKYTTSNGWNSVTITKTKDLTSCIDRVKSPASVFGKQYISEQSKFQNTPLLVGNLICEQIVSGGLIQNVECTERHVFSPLSRSGKGAAVKSISKMVFKEQRDGITSEKMPIGQRSNLLFSTNLQSTAPTDNSAEIREVLQQICSKSRDGVRPRVPILIARLITILRTQSYDSVSRIYEDLANKQLCPSEIVRDIFVDAVSIAGTEGPVKLMVKLAKEEKLSSVRQQTWLLGMAFNTHVDEGVIKAILPLLKDYTLGGRQALLSISSMVHTFCNNMSSEDNGGDCEDLPIIKEVIVALQKQLGNKCKANDKEEAHRIREVLAAFENIGRTGDAEDSLIECFQNSENSFQIRQSAILAFRRAPCKTKVTRKMESLFQNKNEDAAVRIYAYRGAMRCADQELIQNIVQSLETEQVQQVGAYVTSHLKNMKETSSPLKQETRKLLNKVQVPKKFPSDPRKYSQYLEMSSFSEKLNAGGEFEVSVVRSPKTFVPRSAALNMTVYALGSEINMFEIGAEMEGWTHLLEKYFGDNGYFSRLSLDDLMVKLGLKEDGEAENEVEDEEEGERKRETRDTKDQALSRINLFHERMGVTTPDDPKVSAHLSLLGKKIGMLYGTDIKSFFEMKEAFSIMEILTEMAQKQKVERSVSFQLVDTELIVPSISGMAISLAVNATGVVALQAEGKFDIRKLLTEERGADIDGYLSPSGAVAVSAVMSVDSGVHKSAIKVVANLHTSQYIEGKLLIKDGRILDLKVNMPKEKVEVLTFKSDVFTVEPNGEEKAVTPPAFHTLDRCSHIFDRPLGMEFCAEMKAPKPLYNKNGPLVPIAGPMELLLTIKKTDKSLRGYNFHLEVPGEHDYNELKYIVEFDTPGSSIDRHFSAEAIVNRKSEEKTLNYRLTSPFKKLSGSASLVSHSDLSQARFSVTVDEKDVYAIKGELKTSSSSGKTDVEPSLEIHLPKGEPIIFKGTMSLTTGKKDQIVIDLQSNRPINKPSFIRGTLVKEGEFTTRNLDGRLKVSTDITFSTPFLEARLHGTGDKQDTVYSSDLALTYKVPNKNEHSAKFIAKVQNLSTKHLTKISTKTEATFSQYPEANTLVSWDFQHKPKEHLENDFKISNGEHYMNEEGKLLHILQVSKLQGIEQNGRKGETENILLFDLPFLEHDVELSVKTQWNVIDKPSFNFNGDLKYQDDKHIQAAINYKYISNKPMEMEIEAKLSTPNHEFAYQDRVKERSPNEYEGKTMVQWAKDKRANIEYLYRIKTDSSKVHHEVDLQMTSPYSKVPIHQKALLRVTRDTIDIRSHTKYEGRPLYSIDAKLARTGISKIEIEAFELVGEVEVHNEDKSKSARIHLKNKEDTWNYGASTEYKWDRNEKSVAVQAAWDNKRGQSKQLGFTASLNKLSPRYKVEVHGHYGKDSTFNVEGNIDKYIISGTHDIIFDLNAPQIKPVKVIYHHEMQDNTARCTVRYMRNNEQQLEIRTHVKLESGRVVDVSAGFALTSVNRNLDGKEVSVTFRHERRSENYLVTIRAQSSAAKPYTLNLEYTTEPEGSHKKIRAHAILTTPLPRYRSQEALVTLDLSRTLIKVNADLSNAQNKQLQSEFLLQGTLEKGSGNFNLKTPFKTLKSLKLSMEVDENGNAYTTQSFVEVNDDRKLEWNSRFESNRRSALDSTVNIRSAIGPKYDVSVHVVRSDDKNSLDFEVKREDIDVVATHLLVERQDHDYNAHMRLAKHDWSWTVDAKKERKSRTNQVYTLSSTGLGKPVEVTLNWKQEANEIAPEFTICTEGSKCIKIEGRNKFIDSAAETRHEVEVKFQEPAGEQIRLSHLFLVTRDKFETEGVADLWGKMLGYETSVEFGDKDAAHMKLKLPSRDLLARVNWKEVKDTIKIEGEFLGDALREPSRKLTVDISHKSTSQQDGISTHSVITINHPDLKKPISADVVAGFYNGKSRKPMELKAEIDYSSDPNQKLTAELNLERPNNDGSNVTLSFQLYQTDRNALDVAVQMHLGNDDSRTTTGTKWKVVIPDRKWKGMEYIEFDKTAKQIHYYFRCPSQQYEVHASWELEPGKTFVLDANYHDEKEQKSARMSVDIPKPCVELTFFEQPDKPSARYHVCIDSKSKEILSLTAEAYAEGEKLTDAKIVFDRRDEKSFSAHIHWRPEKVGEIMYQLMEWSDQSHSEPAFMETIMKIAESLRSMAEAVQNSVLSPLAEHVSKEAMSIAEELQSDFRRVRQMSNSVYENLPEVEDIFSPVTTVLKHMYTDLKQLAEDLTPRAAEQFVRDVIDGIKDRVSSACSSGTHCYNIRYAFERKGMEGVGEYIYGQFENMPDAYYKIMVATKDMIIANLEMPTMDFRPLENALESIAEWAKEQLEPLLTSEFIQKAEEKIEVYVKQIQEKWEEASNEVKVEVEKRLQKLLNMPEIKTVIEILDEIKQQIEKEIKKLNLKKTGEQVQSFAQEFLSPEALSNAVRVVTLDPENGKIDIEVNLVKSPEEIKILLKASNPFAVKNEEEEETEEIEDVSSSAGDKVAFAQAALKQEWVPPFKAHAQLVGGQHYITFDNTFYDFAGVCSYLLARDFVDGNFSVIVKYEGQGNKGTGSIDKSIIVLAGNKHLEINPDKETILVDEQEVELPFVYKSVTIVRRGSTVVIDYKGGLSVTCHLIHDYCTTAISGWYYGKTAGLFGTYDHEPHNDFLRPKGKIAQDPVNFARSWEVSTGCTFRNLAQEVNIDPEDEKYEICRQAFRDSSSPLKPCFQELNEEDYMRMCMRQVAIQRSPSEAMCTVAAAFAHLCRQKHYQVSLPSQCLKCQPKSGEALDFGARRRIQPSQVQSADVVFVIEERGCNRPLVKEMESISRLIDRGLMDSGLTQNRFGVVAFGGLREERDSHSHTARGKIFFEQKDVVLATQKMTFRPDSKKSQSDTFEALTAAIRYPFRTGASKNLVLLTCSQCDEDTMSVSYSDIQNMLLQHGITLHTLTERVIKIRKSSSKGKTIYGMDSHKVYTSKDRRLEGDSDLRSQVSYQKDVCIALAQEVGGSFFTTMPVTEGSATESKNWKSTLGRRVAMTAAPHQCQECDCTASQDDVPIAVCRPCRALQPKRPVSMDQSEEDEY